MLMWINLWSVNISENLKRSRFVDLSNIHLIEIMQYSDDLSELTSNLLWWNICVDFFQRMRVSRPLLFIHTMIPSAVRASCRWRWTKTLSWVWLKTRNSPPKLPSPLNSPKTTDFSRCLRERARLSHSQHRAGWQIAIASAQRKLLQQLRQQLCVQQQRLQQLTDRQQRQPPIEQQLQQLTKCHPPPEADTYRQQQHRIP